MWNGCNYGRHAEIDAMLHLPPNKKYNKKILDIIVIRVLKNGQIKNSKPCSKCLQHLNNIKGYKIKNVYYSTDDGNILVEKFSKLFNSETKHISKRFKYKMK